MLLFFYSLVDRGNVGIKNWWNLIWIIQKFSLKMLGQTKVCINVFSFFFFAFFFFQHSLSRLLPLSDTIFGFKLVVHCSSESYVENFTFLKHLCWIKYLIFSQDRDNSCIDRPSCQHRSKTVTKKFKEIFGIWPRLLEKVCIH